MSRIIEPQQAQRDLVPEGSAIAKAPDYSLKRWVALARYADDWRCTYRQQLGRGATRSRLMKLFPLVGTTRVTG